MMTPTPAALQIAAMREMPSLRPLMRTCASEIGRILIISLRVLRDFRPQSLTDPRRIRPERELAGAAIYAASPKEAGCAPLRSLVSATATANIQMKPRNLVMGIKKFAGYATRLREET